MAGDDRLPTLLDENEIRRLASCYSDAITHLDAARAASVYAEDGIVSIVGQEIGGREAIEAGLRDSLAAFSLLQLIQHAGLIDIDGDRATARWSTIELTVRKGAEQVGVVFGRYEDRLVRLPEGWRFSRRTFTLAGRSMIESAKLQLSAGFFEG